MENKKNNTNIPECCNAKERKSKGFIQGVIYGTIPHAGCIAFVLFSIMGMTFAASLFKNLLTKSYLFYAMMILSFVFATLSAIIYLRKNGGTKNYKNHKKYLTILYGTTIIVSIIMYFLIFPLIASVSASSGSINVKDDIQAINLKVSIPCEGHASLITDELKKLNGVQAVQFTSPNYFLVSYDSSKLTKDNILNLEIFKEFKAEIK